MDIERRVDLPKCGSSWNADSSAISRFRYDDQTLQDDVYIYFKVGLNCAMFESDIVWTFASKYIIIDPGVMHTGQTSLATI